MFFTEAREERLAAAENIAEKFIDKEKNGCYNTCMNKGVLLTGSVRSAPFSFGKLRRE